MAFDLLLTILVTTEQLFNESDMAHVKLNLLTAFTLGSYCCELPPSLVANSDNHLIL